MYDIVTIYLLFLFNSSLLKTLYPLLFPVAALAVMLTLITINTNLGVFMCVIKPTNLYIFKELEYGEVYDIPQDSAWVLEHSQDQSASAVVYEHNFNPLFESEKSLSLKIVWALSELEKVYKN